MNRERWLAAWGYKDGTPEADKAWALKEAFVPFQLPALIVGDIKPYRAVAADRETGERPMITSRSQHREFLNRNGYFEIGNEKPKSIAAAPDKQEIGRQIKQTMDQKGIRA